MIRKFNENDLDTVMKIWLSANIQAHNFIPEKYWIEKYDMVKNLLPKAELYVFEKDSQVEAFIGLENGYIAGIFVSSKMRSNGIGKLLLEYCKLHFKKLSLCVYEKNSRAVSFYQREGFTIAKEQLDHHTGEKEYFMRWENE